MFYKKEIFPYVVILKNDGVRSINIIGLMISLLSIILFAGEFVINADRNWVWCIGAVALLLVIIWNGVQYKKNKPYFYKPAFIFAAITWLSMPYFQWVALPLVVLYFLEHQAKRNLEIGFSDEKIVVNQIFKRTIYWEELSNVMLKDNLLTIDFINNKIIQKEVLDDEDPDADEEEFNHYCNLQLIRSRTE